MATLRYRFYHCPDTGMRVHGYVVDDPAKNQDEAIYEVVTCSACTRRHLINRKTGEVVGTR